MTTEPSTVASDLMAYLLNLIYLLLLILGSPWFVYAAIRKGKYREGLGAKFWAASRFERGPNAASGCTPSASAKSICWRRCWPGWSSSTRSGST